MELKFVDPPESNRGGSGLQNYQIAEALRARPGEWALVGEGIGRATANNIKAGLIHAYRPAGSFEAVGRNGNGRTADIYARYVGEASK